MSATGTTSFGTWSLGRGAQPTSEDEWTSISQPQPVAACLREQGKLSFERPMDLDADDWWYRCRFNPPAGEGEQVWLTFEGLATLVEVSLNGEQLFVSDNMYLRHRLDVAKRLRVENELVLRCRALTPLLAAKRPRPRWKTRMVDSQNLRWFRTTFLGRMPGWSPPIAVVGPWRPVTLERSTASLDALRTRVVLEGTRGVVRVEGRVVGAADGVTFSLVEQQTQADLDRDGRFVAEASIVHPGLWWPNGYGNRHFHRAALHTRSTKQALWTTDIAFRTLERVGDSNGFGLRVNGQEIFARGASWTPLDVMRPHASSEEYHAALLQAQDAGINMLRLSGTLLYESELFHGWCDALGILVWQDFMFANCDYPTDDASFITSVRTEATQWLERHGHRPSTAVLCGNSEVEQQAAMRGLASESWKSALFYEALPNLCQELAPQVPYLSSTPSGGALPFHVNEGVAHYYGVGAYRRPPEDARRAGVRFASECLAFANVPEQATLNKAFPGVAPVHHPRWKERVPRDNGSSWDFEDIRDHYLGSLFGVSPFELRAEDPERYLAMSRVVPGELMERTFAEWRREGSGCSGGLVWFLRDLWPGAGWGVVDSMGRPKAAWYALKRVLATRAVLLTDEGVNGLVAHLVNDSQYALDGLVRYTSFREGEQVVTRAERALHLRARSQTKIAVDALVQHFTDSTYAYRFGPPGHDAAMVEWLDAKGALASRAFHFPLGLGFPRETDLGLSAKATPMSRGRYQLRIETKRLARWVSVDAPDYIPSDGAFHLPPGGSCVVELSPVISGAALRGTVQALNGIVAARIVGEDAA